VVDVIKDLGITDVTCYRWRQEYGGCRFMRKNPNRRERHYGAGESRVETAAPLIANKPEIRDRFRASGSCPRE
jgi:hypothetical protein